MAAPQPLRALSLRLLILCVGASTVVGALAFFAGVEQSDTLQKLLVTSLCITGACVFVFAGVAGMGRGGTSVWAVVTAVAAMLGFGLLLVGTWVGWASRLPWRLAESSIIVAAASGWIVILGAARLRTGHRWVRRVTCALALLFAVLLLLTVWQRRTSDDRVRLLCGVGVLLLGGTLLVPILARMGQAQGEIVRVGLGARTRYCPACGHGVEHEANPAKCGACGRVFRVVFEGEAASPFQ